MKCLHLLWLLLCLLSCAPSAKQQEPTPEALPDFKATPVEVQTAEAVSGEFFTEIRSTGHLEARRMADINFPLAGMIDQVPVTEGSRVKKADLLCSIDAQELLVQRAKLSVALEKAVLELDDRLIDYGYRLKDTGTVPTAVLRMAKIKSGFFEAHNAYWELSSSIAKSKIRAPFKGVVTELKAKSFNATNNYPVFCRLIDDDVLNVKFPILENELLQVKKGAELHIYSPATGLTARCVVASIDPVVDGNGLIRVTGQFNNAGHQFLAGMQVEVRLSRSLGIKVSVPKSALLKRDGKFVVFTVSSDIAHWNYVEPGAQNGKYVSINQGLREGQVVVISNNMTLANGSVLSVTSSAGK